MAAKFQIKKNNDCAMKKLNCSDYKGYTHENYVHPPMSILNLANSSHAATLCWHFHQVCLYFLWFPKSPGKVATFPKLCKKLFVPCIWYVNYFPEIESRKSFQLTVQRIYHRWSLILILLSLCSTEQNRPWSAPVIYFEVNFPQSSPFCSVPPCH